MVAHQKPDNNQDAGNPQNPRYEVSHSCFLPFFRDRKLLGPLMKGHVKGLL